MQLSLELGWPDPLRAQQSQDFSPILYGHTSLALIADSHSQSLAVRVASRQVRSKVSLKPKQDYLIPLIVGGGFPGGSDSKKSSVGSVGDGFAGVPVLGKSARGGFGNGLQCSCLETPHGHGISMEDPGRLHSIGSERVGVSGIQF